MNTIQLNKTYDELCDKADNLLKEHNPCDIKNNTCTRGREFIYKSFCCGRCKHLTKKGCRAKALICKIWVCRHAFARMNLDFKEKQRAIMQEAYDSKLLYMRTSKQEALDAAKDKIKPESVFEADGVYKHNQEIYLYHYYLEDPGALP